MIDRLANQCHCCHEVDNVPVKLQQSGVDTMSLGCSPLYLGHRSVMVGNMGKIG